MSMRSMSGKSIAVDSDKRCYEVFGGEERDVEVEMVYVLDDA